MESRLQLFQRKINWILDFTRALIDSVAKFSVTNPLKILYYVNWINE